MGVFTAIASDAFESITLEAGVLLSSFDPANPAVNDANIICATTGGIKPSCTPNFEDYGADIDNCPENTKELKKLKGWTCTLSFTALNVTPATLKLALGVADTNASKVTPRNSVQASDFRDLWWVGDRADGGFVAVKLKNALSTGGLKITSTKNGKGQLEVELTGHYSMSNTSDVPMEFYAASGTDASTALTSLTIGQIALNPSFKEDVYEYTASTTAANAVITAAPAASAATVVIKNGATTVNNGASATLSSGENTVTVKVTNSGKEKTYTVVVTKS